jgi:hypothetical protein
MAEGKTLYHVQWGTDSGDVWADNETDAWADFCAGCDLARRAPNLYARVIAPVTEDEPVAVHAEGQSPVHDLSADDAKDHIGRMRSSEKLGHVVDFDSRVTVREAAVARLSELQGEAT